MAKLIEKDQEYTTIGIFGKTKERLEKMGSKGDTFDQIVNQLLDLYEGKQKKM